MRVLISISFATALIGLGTALCVLADEPEQLLTNPGFRPESALSTTFLDDASTAMFAVFPTIIRTVDETTYSSASQQWVADFLELNMLGTGKVANTQLAMGQLQGTSQFEMFHSSMATIGRQLSERDIQEDYVIAVEVLIPPTGPKAVKLGVFGVHCFVLTPNGDNAYSFLLNSHHKAFNDAGLQTSDFTVTGREWLATESTKLALLALKSQIDQDPRSGANAAGTAATNTLTRMIDDFNAGLPSGMDEIGLPVGFHTFSDSTSTAKISTTAAHPALADEITGNQVLRTDLNLTGWAGLIHSFENAATDAWVAHDWRAFLGLRFWIYGNNTGTTLFIDLLDNRRRYSTTDDAERYTYQFKDDFTGWRQVTVPFARMVRKEIGNAAPNDGLNLSAVHGWAFGSASSLGQITYYIDDFELYGGRVSLPSDQPMPVASDDSWRVLQTKEGRFGVSVSVRMDPPAGMRSPDQPSLAIFTWHYRARANGMPKKKAELEQLLSWAARLDELLVAKRTGFQFATRGGAKRLRVYFYVADVEELKELSLAAGEQQIETEMDLNVSEDPTWEEWRRLGRPTDAERNAARANLGEIVTPASAMDSILRFDGFFVRRPNDYRWRLTRNYRTPHVASFTFAPLSPTHSFNASIMLRGLPKEFLTKEEFKAFIDSKLQEFSPRFDVLSLESSMTELHGQWAINYQSLVLDKSPINSEAPLHMRSKGVIFVHPLREMRVIDAFYSERGTAAELDGELEPVGEELINNVIPER